MSDGKVRYQPLIPQESYQPYKDKKGAMDSGKSVPLIPIKTNLNSTEFQVVAREMWPISGYGLSFITGGMVVSLLRVATNLEAQVLQLNWVISSTDLLTATDLFIFCTVFALAREFWSRALNEPLSAIRLSTIPISKKNRIEIKVKNLDLIERLLLKLHLTATKPEVQKQYLSLIQEVLSSGSITEAEREALQSSFGDYLFVELTIKESYWLSTAKDFMTLVVVVAGVTAVAHYLDAPFAAWLGSDSLLLSPNYIADILVFSHIVLFTLALEVTHWLRYQYHRRSNLSKLVQNYNQTLQDYFREKEQKNSPVPRQVMGDGIDYPSGASTHIPQKVKKPKYLKLRQRSKGQEEEENDSDSDFKSVGRSRSPSRHTSASQIEVPSKDIQEGEGPNTEASSPSTPKYEHSTSFVLDPHPLEETNNIEDDPSQEHGSPFSRSTFPAVQTLNNAIGTNTEETFKEHAPRLESKTSVTLATPALSSHHSPITSNPITSVLTSGGTPPRTIAQRLEDWKEDVSATPDVNNSASPLLPRNLDPEFQTQVPQGGPQIFQPLPIPPSENVLTLQPLENLNKEKTFH